ncbi:MAG TPA: radical SAM protein, partial [Ignavibacteriaceae bacterium]|nr:radical SAM protein [Ignavibacteriaceae bacterium]
MFGPIPSRRLGRSLGINNIPPKVCSYSCVYCQVGSTDTMSIQRREFFSTEEIYNEVKSRVSQLNDAGEIINFLSFVPDGEPTLDVNLGKTIEKLKIFDIKIAVISNSSLMWDENARNDLMKADWVSLKTDSLFNNEWHKINRPHKRLELAGIVDGIEK